jgi:uncharacterized damage-inducible protein DinB
MKSDEEGRPELAAALAGKGAHVDFESAVRNFLPVLRGKQPEGVPHTAWQLVEHIRIAQADILDFCVNSNYKELEWPEDYWPKNPAPPNDSAWDESIAQFRRDLEAMKNLISDPARDLHARIPHGDGQTLFREALLVIDHNSYHVGQLVFVRQLLGIWPPRKK